MASIVWEKRLETGHEAMDGEHRTLIDTFNRIAATALRAGPNHDELEGLLIFLRSCAFAHFEREQELMARHGYPGEAEHRRQHTELAGQVEAFLDAFHQRTTTLDAATLEYLEGWLDRHIQEEDFRLAEFLKRAQANPKGRS